MADDIMPIRTRFFLPDLLMTIFVRMVAIACLWFALMIWADLIGYSRGGAMRFDLISSDMKAAVPRSPFSIRWPPSASGSKAPGDR